MARPDLAGKSPLCLWLVCRLAHVILQLPSLNRVRHPKQCLRGRGRFFPPMPRLRPSRNGLSRMRLLWSTSLACAPGAPGAPVLYPSAAGKIMYGLGVGPSVQIDPFPITMLEYSAIAPAFGITRQPLCPVHIGMSQTTREYSLLPKNIAEGAGLG